MQEKVSQTNVGVHLVSHQMHIALAKLLYVEIGFQCTVIPSNTFENKLLYFLCHNFSVFFFFY